jgi:hypothetical protein
MSTVIPSNEFSQFCDFIVQLRDAGAQDVTPEQSVEEFRREQEKLRVWHERNAISQEQARRGEAKPLDLDAIMTRVRKRLAEHGITD